MSDFLNALGAMRMDEFGRWLLLTELVIAILCMLIGRAWLRLDRALFLRRHARRMAARDAHGEAV